jgi:hypothetical protein
VQLALAQQTPLTQLPLAHCPPLEHPPPSPLAETVRTTGLLGMPAT